MISKPENMRREEYKCKVLQMHLKLRDQQLKSVLYIQRLLYQHFMATTNQKSTIDGHTKKKVQSKHNTKGSLQITKEENKRGRGEKDLQKQTKNKPKTIKCQ